MSLHTLPHPKFVVTGKSPDVGAKGNGKNLFEIQLFFLFPAWVSDPEMDRLGLHRYALGVCVCVPLCVVTLPSRGLEKIQISSPG